MSPMPAEAAQAVLTATEVTPPAATGMDHERCDRCRARAHVVTVHTGGLPLAWCGHRFARHELALRASAGVIVAHDTRHLLVPTQRVRV